MIYQFRKLRTSGNFLNLYVLGDWHIGSPDCHINLIKQVVRRVRRDPHGLAIFIGDALDAGTKNSPTNVFLQSMSPQEQYEEFQKLIRPIIPKLIGAHIGNHEHRFIRETGMDIMKTFCDSYHVPYLGFGAITELKVGGETYKIFSIHGRRGGITTTGKIRALLNMSQRVDADLYLRGHSHVLLWEYDYIKRIIDGKSQDARRLYVMTGSMLQYDGSYGEWHEYSIEKPAQAVIRLYARERKVTIANE